MEKTKKSRKRLKAAKELTHVVGEYYMECASARAQGRPVGWMPPMNGEPYKMSLQCLTPLTSL